MSLDDLTEEVLSANVDVLAAAFNPYLSINYIKANDVVEQKNDYDCGVCSSQRVFFANALTIQLNFLKIGIILKIR
jgi:hypothetical protein